MNITPTEDDDCAPVEYILFFATEWESGKLASDMKAHKI